MNEDKIKHKPNRIEAVDWTKKRDNEWKCYLFGSNETGIVWRPPSGTEPNWFWRKMQYLFFGNRWEKEDKQA